MATRKTQEKNMAPSDAKGMQASQNEKDVSDLVKDGILDESEADLFALANPELNFYKCQNEDGSMNTLRGVLLDRRPRPDGEGHYYVVGLTKPCKLYKGAGEPIEGAVGDYAWVDERWAMQSLARYLPVKRADSEGVQGIVQLSEVICQPKEQVKLDKGRSLWKFAIRVRNISPKAVSEAVGLMPPATTDPPNQIEREDNADIPF